MPCPSPSLLAAALVWAAASAWAHPTIENDLTLQIADGRAVIDMEVTLEEILVAQGVRPGSDGGYDLATLEAAAQRHRGYLSSRLFVEAAGSPLPLQVTSVVPPARFSTAHATIYRYELQCTLPGAGAETVQLRHEMLRESSYSPGVPWSVSYVVRAKVGNKNLIEGLRSGHPVTVPTGWQPSHSPATAQPPISAEESIHWAWLMTGAAIALALAATRWNPNRRRAA